MQAAVERDASHFRHIQNKSLSPVGVQAAPLQRDHAMDNGLHLQIRRISGLVIKQNDSAA